MSATSTTPIGNPGGLTIDHHPTLGEGYVAAPYEENWELVGPRFIAVVDRMRKTDGQISALIRATALPILANRRTLDTTGVPPEVVTLVRSELGLAEVDTDGDGQPDQAVRRTGDYKRFSLREHLRQALLAPWYGYMPFQPIFSVGAPRPDQVEAMGEDDVAHLVRVSVRLPRTITDIRVTADGELAGLIQAPLGWDAAGTANHGRVTGGGGNADDTETWIDAQWLAMYSFEREGADWYGSSLLRSVYKNWLLKDDLLRIDSFAAERNGMGIPVVKYGAEGDRTTALNIARDMRGGTNAGVAVKEGEYSVELLAVTGQVRPVLESVKYHDQAVSRAALAMFLDLGQQQNGLGSTAGLASTFRDFFVMSLQYIDDWVCETFTDTVIRELVAVNFGEGVPYPALVADDISADAPPTADALKLLSEAGLITPDRGTENVIRARHRLPVKPEPTGTAAVEDAAGSPVADVGIPALIGAGVIDEDEGRAMLKLPGKAPGRPVVAMSEGDTVTAAELERARVLVARLDELRQ